MNNQIINKVNAHIKEMRQFQDPSVKNIMVEVRDSSIPLSVKVELIQKLSLASDKISGKYTSPTQLMKAPKYSTRRRNTSYRAKYSGNFSGGGLGTSRTSRQ